MTDLAAILRQKINESKESQYQIAKGAGIEQSAISRFMNGERSLSLAAAGKLIDYFNIVLCARSGHRPVINKAQKGGRLKYKWTKKGRKAHPEIVRLSLLGMSRPKIAAAVGMSVPSVSTHIRHARQQEGHVDPLYKKDFTTPKRKEILRLGRKGLSRNSIAIRLGVSFDTVSKHLERDQAWQELQGQRAVAQAEMAQCKTMLRALKRHSKGKPKALESLVRASRTAKTSTGS